MAYSMFLSPFIPITPCGTLYLEGAWLVFGTWVEHSQSGKHLIFLCYYTISKLGNRTGDSFVPWSIKWNYFTTCYKATHDSNSNKHMKQFRWDIYLNIYSNYHGWMWILSIKIFTLNVSVVHDLNFIRCFIFPFYKVKTRSRYLFDVLWILLSFHQLLLNCTHCSFESYWFPFF